MMDAISFSKPGSWISEIVAAFGALGGAARYDDLYEYVQRTTKRKLTEQWRATIRRTIEDHSSDSKNFRAGDLFRHLDHGFWALRSAGDISVLINARAKRSAKVVVDEILDTSFQSSNTKMVYVREHWRKWPEPRESESITLDQASSRIVDAWVSHDSLEIKLASGLVLKAPLSWFEGLSLADQSQKRQIEFGDYGVYWPQLNIEVVLPEILSSRSGKGNRN